MSDRFPICRLLGAALLAAAWPAQALAVPAVSDASGTAHILAPLSVQKLADLDFGRSP